MTPLDRAALAADPRNQSANWFPTVAAQFAGARCADDHPRCGGVRGCSSRPRVSGGRSECIATNRSKRRALSLAVNHGQIQIVRLLLDLGADVDERILLVELEEPTISWGTPLWYAAPTGQRDIAELLLDRGADTNANVYASGWPLRNAWNHKDHAVKRLLLSRGAKPQPYMVAEAHDVTEARRLLESDASEELANELAWSAADHGSPAIVELAIQRLNWTADDARWHWIFIQPIRGCGRRK